MQVPIYLDYSSTTPVDPRVVEKMVKCLSMEGNFGNPASRSHVFGWKAEEAVETARRHVADLLNCDPGKLSGPPVPLRPTIWQSRVLLIFMPRKANTLLLRRLSTRQCWTVAVNWSGKVSK